MAFRRWDRLDYIAHKILDKMIELWKARPIAIAKGDDYVVEGIDDEIAKLKSKLKELKDEDGKKSGGGRR